MSNFIKQITNYCNKMGTKLIYVSGAIVYKNIYENLIDEKAKKGINFIGGIYGLSKILVENILERNFLDKISL